MSGGRSSSYYAVLGVHPGASAAEIRAAYHRLAMRWHPDKVGQGPVPANPRGVPGAVGRQAAGALRRRHVRPARRRPGGGRGLPRLPPGDGLAHGDRREGGARVQPGRAAVHARRDDPGLRLAAASPDEHLLHRWRRVRQPGRHAAALLVLTHASTSAGRRRRGVLHQDGVLQVIHPSESGKHKKHCGCPSL